MHSTPYTNIIILSIYYAYYIIYIQTIIYCMRSMIHTNIILYMSIDQIESIYSVGHKFLHQSLTCWLPDCLTDKTTVWLFMFCWRQVWRGGQWRLQDRRLSWEHRERTTGLSVLTLLPPLPTLWGKYLNSSKPLNLKLTIFNLM